MNSVEREFEPIDESLRLVRRFVREALPENDFQSDVVLVASELATNVVRHARTPFTVRLSGTEGAVRLEVADGSSIVPAVEELAKSKRGLRVVERVSRKWGVELTEDGKTVWAGFVSGSAGPSH